MGFVLTGGKSSRMGADKALLQFEGRTLLERAIDVLRRACKEFAIVGDPARFGTVGKAIADVYSGCGPLAGIHAALQYSSAELNVVIAVDMPFVSSELITFLQDAAETYDALVTVPRTSRGLQPLCAVYRPAFAAVAEEALKAGKYKIDALFPGTAVRVIEEADLAAAGFSERNFLNVNTAADLHSARSQVIKP